MMTKKCRVTNLVLLGLLFSLFSVQGLEDTGFFCTTNADCYDDASIGKQCNDTECVCSAETETCLLKEAAASQEEVAGLKKSLATLQNATANKTALKELEKNIAALQTQTATVEERLSAVEENVALVQQQLSEYGSSIDTLNAQVADQDLAKQDLQSDVNTVATGLAGLQGDVQETQEEVDTVEQDLQKVQRFRKIVIIAAVVLIAAGTALAVLYFTRTKKMDPRLVEYIARQLKQGKLFPQIQEALRRVGWADDEIKRGFQEGIRASTKQARAGGMGRPTGTNQKKVVLLAGFGIFLVIGIILVLKGVTTGKAIHFKTTEELNTAVKENIEKNLKTNPFYEQVKAFDLCVQVEDEENVVSYRVQKTKKGDLVKETAVNCDNSEKYGFAVKFKSWEAFDLVSNTLSCSNMKAIHAKNLLYVLPSKTILPGFEVDPTTDLAPFCDALKLCLTEKQLQDAEMEC